MKIQKVTVKSYKSILDSGPIELSKDITVFVGRNNSGKTALAECMRFTRYVNDPFRGFADAEEFEDTSVEVDLLFSGQELLSALSKAEDKTLSLPIPSDRMVDASVFVQEFFSSPEIVISVASIAGGLLHASKYPSHSMAEEGAATSIPVSLKTGTIPALVARQSNADDLVRRLSQYMISNIFALSAMRNIPAISRMETNGELDAAGTMLPACLFYLQGHLPWLFEKLKLHLIELVPEITNITFIPVNGEQVEVRVWLQAYRPPEQEISLSLSQCGTGVGQILSLLYISMVSTGKVIIIDEPNSFLHPGATKRLVEILSSYKNQYVITTHSPEIVSNPSRKIVYGVRKEGGKSEITKISMEKVANLRDVLSDLGIAFGDVFGVEDIVWVEGETEQLCFPKILAFDRIHNKTSFIVVRNTGDFQKKGLDVEKVVGVYERLSNSVALFPSKVRFSFDKEKMTDQQIADLKRRVQDRISILPRRTFENYLVHPDSIAAILNEYMDPSVPRVTPAGVTGWITVNISSYGPAQLLGNAKAIDEKFDLARMLHHIFEHFSASTLEFRKTTHSPLLVDRILDNDPNFLAELRTYVRDLVSVQLYI